MNKIRLLIRKYILRKMNYECNEPEGKRCRYNLGGRCYRYSYELNGYCSWEDNEF